MKNQVLCLGSAGKDIFFPTTEGQVVETPDDLMSQKKFIFELGAKYKIQERYEALGGSAANVAVGLVKLGISVACASVIGDDLISIWIREELRKNKVDLSLIKVQEKAKSDLSAIIVDYRSADRTIFSNRGLNGKLELEAENFREVEWIFLGDISGKWEDQLEDIIQLAKEENKKIAFNPRGVHIQEDPVEIIKAVSLCEILFVNKDEAMAIISQVDKNISAQNLNQEEFLLKKFQELEVEVVVITDGKRGAWAMNKNGIVSANGLGVSAVDSTGAGDSFASGFLAAYIKSKDISECLQWGIANSSNEVQFYGSIDGLLGEEEMEKKSKDVILQ